MGDRRSRYAVVSNVGYPKAAMSSPDQPLMAKGNPDLAARAKPLAGGAGQRATCVQSRPGFPAPTGYVTPVHPRGFLAENAGNAEKGSASSPSASLRLCASA